MLQLAFYSFGTFITLFPIADPVSAIPIFYKLTANNSKKQRLRLALKVALNSCLIITFFFLMGQPILNVLGISMKAFKFIGALLITHTAWMLIRDCPQQSEPDSERVDQKNITLFPMAVPLISGPGAITLAIELIDENPQWFNYLGGFFGIFILGISIYLCLTLGDVLVKILGKQGMSFIQRFLGAVFLCQSLQILIEGLWALAK